MKYDAVDFYDQPKTKIDEEDDWSVLPLLISAIFGLVVGFIIGYFVGCL